MRIVLALGGNALLARGQALTAENQRENIIKSAASIAAIAREHEIVIVHGNGPQVGLLMEQNAAYSEYSPETTPIPNGCTRISNLWHGGLHVATRAKKH